VTASDLATALGSAIRDEEAVEELWVSTDDEAVHLWLVVRAIEPDVERRLYGVEDVLYGRFPEAAFQVHVLNPRYYAGDVHTAVPGGAVKISFRAA